MNLSIMPPCRGFSQATKTNSNLGDRQSRLARLAVGQACRLFLLVGTVLFLGAAFALAQSDNFNDGDDQGWTRYDPIGLIPGFSGVGTWSWPNGNSYRIRTAVSPAVGVVGPGRAGSLRADVVYTDFYMSVDLIDWDNSLDQAIGLLARVSDVGPGSTDGYALTYQVADGDIDITRFTDEDPAGGELTLDGSDVVNMVPGRSYRFVFIGVGSTFTARVFELPQTTFAIVDVTATDTRYSSGICGLINFDNSGGVQTTDATYDNYIALDREPPQIKVTFIPFPFGDLIITWKTNAGNFVLQRAVSLDDPIGWEDVPGPYQIFGDEYTYTGEDVTVQPQRFFQLVRP